MFGRKYFISTLAGLLLAGCFVSSARAAEFEVMDRLTADGYTLLKTSAAVQGNSFTVGGSTFVVKEGKVGIGTAAPGQQLTLGSGNILLPDINVVMGGNFYFGGNIFATRSGLRLFGGLVNYGAYEGGFITAASTSATGGLLFRVDSTTGGSLRMGITTAGNVGINTTAPLALLHISSAAGVSGNMVLISTGSSNVIRMTGAGEIFATKFIGDGSLVTNVVAVNSAQLGGVAAATYLTTEYSFRKCIGEAANCTPGTCDGGGTNLGILCQSPDLNPTNVRFCERTCCRP
ncbi:MAG: hypothetical protein A2021_06395 [Elusimicrobia bacterium GWF2_52_66]|nr:MAG: hypothetical protein A2021_06395 [Elusimicrobia bacterium GWF2_52_66]HAF95240.1 hypothetical protein [Elusimicrobiota bacterium]HCE97319.1 hypothetical protein [Elusimicrobiota bacterium]